MSKKSTKEVCCFKFDPELWDGKSFNWKKKPFIKESMMTLFHMPLPFIINKKMAKLWDIAEKKNKISSKKEEILILFYDPTPFKTEIYLSVTGSVPNAINVDISGEFICKVYEGAYKEVPKFIKDMDGYLDNKAKKAERYFIHYSYCPKCSKKYGNNYMTFFAKVK